MAVPVKRTKAILVTGACGEIGSNLLRELLSEPEFLGDPELGDSKRHGDSATRIKSPESYALVGFDILPPTASHKVPTVQYVRGDITDPAALASLESDYDFETIFHLAAVLSTGGEREPEHAYEVNMDGSENILALARRQGSVRERPTKIIFPSTVAAYGIPSGGEEDRETFKKHFGAVGESSFLEPITMYGINKLAVEQLGRYYDRHYALLSKKEEKSCVDFRSIRLPGVLSANTIPTGGTSDYAPEIVHSAAQGKMYECFVRPRTTIPFMAMPDAVKALRGIAAAPKNRLNQVVYNVAGFSVSAQEIAHEVKKHFPDSTVVFKADPRRIRILESWPAAMDDRAARRDWGWAPDYDFFSTFKDYLIPGVKSLYLEKEAPLQAAL